MIYKKLSIIIITLNEEKTIGRLLQSLSKQTYKDFEIIIVDSKSEDKTKEVSLENSKNFKEFKFHTMKKRGASLGRNTGVNLAKYETLLFLDSDVILRNTFIENLMQYSRKKNIFVGSFYIKLMRFNLVQKIGYSLINFGFFITQYFYPTAVGACIFSNKQIHNNIGGFNEEIHLCEDCDYVHKASKKTKFRMFPYSFYFDNRRLNLEGNFQTLFKYLKANFQRFIFKKEFKKKFCSIEYNFGHYHKND